jgi:hypothetical protein
LGDGRPQFFRYLFRNHDRQIQRPESPDQFDVVGKKIFPVSHDLSQFALKVDHD